MKILVTGSAGFIGYHLIKGLVVDKTLSILGIDNINDYYDIDLKLLRLEKSGIDKKEIQHCKLLHSSLHTNYTFAKADIIDKDQMNKLFEEYKPDIVINLAAQAGVRYSLINPDSYIQNNIIGFFNIINCCKNNNVSHLIYASSSSVYGNNLRSPYSEYDKTDSPVSLYAVTKKSNELMAHAYSNLYKMKTTGLRFFTVYGPYGRPDMAPMIFTNSIYKNKPIIVFNEGKLKRDFTYIDDIINNVIKIIKSKHDCRDLYKIYNIGSSNPINIMDFIYELEKFIGKKAEIKYSSMQEGDVYETYSNTTALINDYGNYKFTPLNFGVKKFIEWYNSYI